MVCDLLPGVHASRQPGVNELPVAVGTAGDHELRDESADLVGGDDDAMSLWCRSMREARSERPAGHLRAGQTTLRFIRSSAYSARSRRDSTRSS